MKNALALLQEPLAETLPPRLVEEHHLMSLDEAIRNIHFPKNPELLRKAQYRLKFEELFYVQLNILRYSKDRQRKYRGLRFERVGEIFNTFYSQNLPFELTGAQKRVIKEIRKDMGSGRQMNRLLQGDVGSGKTLVALMSMLIALDNGYQACMMAPTEILAAQHYETIRKFLFGMDVRVMDFFNEVDADVFCIQESKLQEGQIDLDLPGYHQYWNYAEKKGYSGTAMFTKEEPISVSYGLGIEEHDHEGRVITAEFPEYYIVTCYTPNSKDGLARLDYRMTWEDAFLAYLKKLEEKKPVIFCGDLNVAHKEIDLKNPKTNRKNAGFTDEERGKFTDLLNAGFIDTWRYFYPDTEGIYSWWSYRFKAREKNAGWRIDYFCVSESLKDELESAKIHTEVFGSDHCPVELVIKK